MAIHPIKQSSFQTSPLQPCSPIPEIVSGMGDAEASCHTPLPTSDGSAYDKIPLQISDGGGYRTLHGTLPGDTPNTNKLILSTALEAGALFFMTGSSEVLAATPSWIDTGEKIWDALGGYALWTWGILIFTGVCWWAWRASTRRAVTEKKKSVQETRKFEEHEFLDRDDPDRNERTRIQPRHPQDTQNMATVLRQTDSYRSTQTGKMPSGDPLPFQEESTVLSPPPSPPPASTASPSHLVAGKYRITKQIGEGGMGIVYLVHLTQGAQTFPRVMKTLKADIRNEGTEARFHHEIQVAMTVSEQSDHIVRVYDDHGYDPRLGVLFYIMEYLEGEPLLDRMDRGLLPITESLRYFQELCDALKVLHQNGIIHRDIKPENIFLQKWRSSWRVKMLDFGIAKSISRETRVTKDGGLVGTPYYMAPEQLTQQEQTPSSDLYSAAILLYELLTGDLPYEGIHGGSDLMNVLTAHMLQPHIPPSQKNPQLHAFDALFETALQKKPGLRFATIQYFLEAVNAAAEEYFSNHADSG